MNSQVPKSSKTAAISSGKDEAASEPSPEVMPADEASPLDAPRRQGGGGGGANMSKAQRLHAVQGRAGNSQGPGGRMGRGGPLGAQRVAEISAEDTVKARGADPVKMPPRPQPARTVQAASEPVRPPAQPARMKTRHHGILALAFLLIVLPGIATAVYLWKYAVDQYESVAGFAIRTESASTSFDFLGLGGLMGGSTTTGKDMDILNNFLTSQQLVAKLDKELDLRKIFSKPSNDPLFAYNPNGTIEDLVNYWSRMVVVNYDNTTGLMQLNVYAFTPEDAQKIANAVLNESSVMINKLADVAQGDTTRYAKRALDEAQAKLAEARSALTKFRVKNNVVDPTQDLSAQGSVIGSLTQQLVAAQIQLATLQQGAATTNDPRVSAIQQRIDIIQNRIAEEQQKVATSSGAGSSGYAEMVATYEGLKADEDFSQKAYLTALASYDAAVQTAQQKQVYLATYEEPTLAQASTAPRRWLLLWTVLLIGFLAWAIITMIYYALRDRR